MIRLPSHLSRNRLGVFYFRFVLPACLRERFPEWPREFRRSLRTRDPRTAKTAALSLRANFQALMKGVEAMQHGKDAPGQFLIRRAEDGSLQVKVEDGDNPDHLSGLMKAFIETERITAEQALDPAFLMNFNPSQQEVAKVQTQARAMQDGGKGEWLYDALQRYREERTPTWNNPNAWVNDYGPALLAFRELIGTHQRQVKTDEGLIVIEDIRCSDITVHVIRHFRQTLPKVPAYSGQAFRTNKSAPNYKARLAAATNDKKVTYPSSATLVKKFGFVKTFLHWASEDGCIEEGKEFAGVLPKKRDLAPKGRRKASTGYQPLTDGELKKLFESDAFCIVDVAWKYWIPLIGLYTGARINEISQLRLSDILVQDGLPCFSINEEADEDEMDGTMDDVLVHGTGSSAAKPKSVKSAASIRLIPVHPELVSAGLLAYVEQQRKERPAKNELLFPQLEWHAKGNYGREPSAYFSRLTKELGIYQTRKKVFHSFRHTLNVKLQALGVPQEHRELLLGHTSESINVRVYGGQPLQVLSNALSLVKFDFTMREFTPPVSLEGLLS